MGEERKLVEKMTENTSGDSGVDDELPEPKKCLSHLPGHNPHWIQVLRVAPQHDWVDGSLHAERLSDYEDSWVFRFTPNLSVKHTLSKKKCVEIMLFNHDPDRLIAALDLLGELGHWIPGVHLFQIEHEEGELTFDMSPKPVSPCT
jgi:hypothetical protein